jgi:Phage integrase family
MHQQGDLGQFRLLPMPGVIEGCHRGVVARSGTGSITRHRLMSGGEWEHSTRPDRLGIVVTPDPGSVQFLARATRTGRHRGPVEDDGSRSLLLIMTVERRSNDLAGARTTNDHGFDLQVWVELRGFEPLTPSMRTLGSEVVHGRWGRSATGRSRMKSLAADDVAVLVCCTTACLAVVDLAGHRGLRACLQPVDHIAACQHHDGVAVFTGFGLTALTRRHVDLDACTVRVVSSLTEIDRGTLLPGLPKSAAGRRTVQLPPLIVPSLRNHLDRYAQPGDDGLVFVSPRGARLRRSNFRRRVWLPALTKAGLPEIHFHDLRHTGNILTATAGASLRELMPRMGHTSTRAALVYMHDTDERQRAIAGAVNDLARNELDLPLDDTGPT